MTTSRRARRAKNGGRKHRPADRQQHSSGTMDRRHLLSANLTKVVAGWQQAKREESDPVMFVLDLNDPVAAALALACGLSVAEAGDLTDGLRGVAIPTAIACLDRSAAVEFSRESSSETCIAGLLASGPIPGAVDVMVVASAGNTFARIPAR